MNSNDKIGLVVVGGILLAGGAIIALANKTSANPTPTPTPTPAPTPTPSPVETGTLYGMAIDNNGHLLSGVSVVLSNASGNANTITDGSGAYSIASLPLGDYEITVSKPGYQTISYTINILAGQDRQDIVLLNRTTMHRKAMTHPVIYHPLKLSTLGKGHNKLVYMTAGGTLNV